MTGPGRALRRRSARGWRAPAPAQPRRTPSQAQSDSSTSSAVMSCTQSFWAGHGQARALAWAIAGAMLVYSKSKSRSGRSGDPANYGTADCHCAIVAWCMLSQDDPGWLATRRGGGFTVYQFYKSGRRWRHWGRTLGKHPRVRHGRGNELELESSDVPWQGQCWQLLAMLAVGQALESNSALRHFLFRDARWDPAWQR